MPLRTPLVQYWGTVVWEVMYLVAGRPRFNTHSDASGLGSLIGRVCSLGRGAGMFCVYLAL
jgi:hypothetical protein